MRNYDPVSGECPMRQHSLKRLSLLLILLMSFNGCGSGSQSPQAPGYENSRFMAMWETYIHCSLSEELDSMRADAERLTRAADAIASSENPTPSDGMEPVPFEPTARLSVDPVAMAAACALHTGQIAQVKGHRHLAREMYETVIMNYPQPSYRHYVAQARLGLDLLDEAPPSTINTYTPTAGPT